VDVVLGKSLFTVFFRADKDTSQIKKRALLCKTITLIYSVVKCVSQISTISTICICLLMLHVDWSGLLQALDSSEK
jgi:hypothetical protein